MQNPAAGFVRKKHANVTWIEASKSLSPVTFGFFGRLGGVSASPYDSLNVGSFTEDSELDVEMNRQIALDALNLPKYCLALNQVHSDRFVLVTEDRLTNPVRRKTLEYEAERGADAIVCTAKNTPCLIVTADCAPVVIVAPHGFSLVHSGWKGTILRVAAKTVQPLLEETGDCIKDVRAYIGPCIGPQDFEVSSELAKSFVERYGKKVLFNTRHINLAYAIGADLKKVGISKERIFSADISTASHLDEYFSYRMEGKKTGRQATIACICEDLPA